VVATYIKLIVTPDVSQSYANLHRALKYFHSHASEHECEHCQSQADDWANVHGTNGYVTLCHRCHMIYDNKVVTCVRGHDTIKWGRSSYGVCRVCQRLHNQKRDAPWRSGVCSACAYVPCRCEG
jgi:hypothetical protein